MSGPGVGGEAVAPPDEHLWIDVVTLIGRPGERRAVERTAHLTGIGIESATVPAGAAIDLDLEVEAIVEGLAVTGTVTAPWVGECRRCLDPVQGAVATRVREIFTDEPTEGETYPIVDDRIDLVPLVRDAVLLELPLAPLCDEHCPGPDPDRFPAAAPPEAPSRDPRWAALDQLDFGDEPDPDRPDADQ